MFQQKQTGARRHSFPTQQQGGACLLTAYYINKSIIINYSAFLKQQTKSIHDLDKRGLKGIKHWIVVLFEQVYELCSVDFSLFGEAGLQPGLLHRDRLGVLTRQVLELLVTQIIQGRSPCFTQGQLHLLNNTTNNNNYITTIIIIIVLKFFGRSYVMQICQRGSRISKGTFLTSWWIHSKKDRGCF